MVQELTVLGRRRVKRMAIDDVAHIQIDAFLRIAAEGKEDDNLSEVFAVPCERSIGFFVFESHVSVFFLQFPTKDQQSLAEFHTNPS